MGFFFLLAKRPGSKDDDLIFNCDIDIVRIIDWQMARTAPANESFIPSIATADMNLFCKGKNNLGSKGKLLADILHKKGAEKLANIRSASEKARRFM